MENWIDLFQDPTAMFMAGFFLAIIIAWLLWTWYVVELRKALESGNPFLLAGRHWIARQWGMTPKQVRRWANELIERANWEERKTARRKRND